MSAADSKAAMDRLATKRGEVGAEDFAPYAFLALGFLAWNAPEVLHFIFDRADEALTPTPKEQA